MPLVVLFAEALGAFLLLASAIADASFADVITGKAEDDYRAAQAADATGSGTGATSSTTSGANLSAAQDKRITSADAAAASGKLPAKVGVLLDTATSLIGTPYKWGGGHSSGALTESIAAIKQAGLDCSGFVSQLLGRTGIISSPQTTQTLPDTSGIATGAGKYVTIYDRDDGADGGDHVIIDIAGHWFESGGSSAINQSGNDGVSAIAAPPTSYLSTFNVRLHPIGL
jgi:cell wall-associated NlpC family hydrolase